MTKPQFALPNHHNTLFVLISELISIEGPGSELAKEHIMPLIQDEHHRQALIQAAIQFSMPLPKEVSIVPTFVSLVGEMPSVLDEVALAEQAAMTSLPVDRVEAFMAFINLFLLFKDSPEQLIHQVALLLEDHKLRPELVEWAQSIWLCHYPYFMANGVITRTVDALHQWAHKLFHSRNEK